MAEFSILAYVASWCPDCVEAHKLLKRSGLPYKVIDIESVPGAEDEMIALASGVRKVPTIVIDGPLEDRQVLVEPYPEELAEALRQLIAEPIAG